MSRRKSPDGKRETIGKIRDIADRIVREAHDLCDKGEISDEDLEKITTAIGELFTHLNDKYDADAKLNEEVSGMIKALYDERVFMRGRDEGEARGIAKGEKARSIEIAKSLLDVLDIETIAKKTKLTIEEVENLKNKGA
jgi:predicted transposase/invertase (TIGR01784 family)